MRMRSQICLRLHIRQGRPPPVGKSATSVDAASEQAAIAALLNRNLLVFPSRKRSAGRAKPRGGKVSLADLVIFTRQLATMIDAGLAMVQALQALSDQTTNKVMRDVIKDVCTRVESGDSFSEALESIRRRSTGFMSAMVSAGEKGGLLAEIWRGWPPTWKTPTGSAKRSGSAMMYPTAVTAVAICITVFLLVKVMPVFKDIFSGLARNCPARRRLMNVSDIRETLAAAGHHWSLRRAVYGWLLLHQNQERPGVLGRPAHQAAHLRPHRA